MNPMLLAVLSAAQLAGGGTSVVGSRHDLSVTGPGSIRAESERQVCVFCHIPHAGGEKLSSRPETQAIVAQPYRSSTASARAGAPTGASRVCLSCHDGTVAVGDTRRGTIQTVGGGAGGRLQGSRRSNLGTDLRRSHPISIPMAFAPRAQSGAASIRPDSAGQIQCTSCHDPHSEFGGGTDGKFLRDTMRGSSLCLQCHEKTAASSHASSTASFPASRGNDTGFAVVAEAGCAACHRAHGADLRGQLLARDDDEADDAICLRCHSGGVARLDVASESSKPFSHSVGAGQHDAAESPGNRARPLPERSATTPRHAACVDCHDPHEANGRPAAAPSAGGPLTGVWGIDLAGLVVRPAVNQYEICFKCHGDSANMPRPGQGGGFSSPRRAAGDSNLRRVFAPEAPSNHPVARQRSGADVPSLVAPWSRASFIYCTDCHGSDAGVGSPRGPHGSIYPGLLERNYSAGDGTIESPASYALCYKCHDRSVLLSDRSTFRPHRRHVVDEHTPCSACHSAHGVSSKIGTEAHNAHLIDFDLSFVKVEPGVQPYTANGRGTGSCSLTCHGKTHAARSY